MVVRSAPAHGLQLRDHRLLDLGRLRDALLPGIGVHPVEARLGLPLGVEERPDGCSNFFIGQGVAPYADFGPLCIPG